MVRKKMVWSLMRSWFVSEISQAEQTNKSTAREEEEKSEQNLESKKSIILLL